MPESENRYHLNKSVPIENYRVHKEYKSLPVHVKLDEENINHFLQPLPELDLPDLEPQPFFLVRPTGMQYIEQISQLLQEELQMSIKDEFNLNCFETCARYIYPISADDPNSFLWFAASQKYLGKDKSNQGYIFIFDSKYLNSYQDFIQNKRRIRSHIGNIYFRTFYQGRIRDTDAHHIHCPDLNELAYQHNLLQYFSNL